MSTAWPKARLSEVLARSTTSVAIVPDQGYHEITVKLWGKGVVLRGNVSGADIDGTRRFVAKAGQFILSRIDARNGAIGIVPPNLDGAVVSNDFPLFDIASTELEPAFLGWLTKTHDFVEFCQRASEGTTNRVRLQEERFLALEIPLPPLAEQRRIVARIEELAAQIHEARTLRYQAAEETDVLTHARARSFLSTITDPPTQLAEWLHPRREGIQTGPFGAQLSNTEFTESGVPLLAIGNIHYSGLESHDLKFVSSDKANQLSRYRVCEGDILFARMGTVGRCCVVPIRADGWLINYHIIRVALDTSRVEPRFIHWTIQASAEIETYLEDKIRGATREGVNSKIVAALPCRVPPLSEQRQIVAELDALQAEVDALKGLQAATAAELNAMLPAILDRAFRKAVDMPQIKDEASMS